MASANPQLHDAGYDAGRGSADTCPRRNPRRLDTGTILWAKEPDIELAPASLTKVLTALVALENFSPDQAVTVTPDALGQSSADTLMHLKAGQTLTVTELLEGMLLQSGDDAASAIAVDTVGEASFVAAMNAQVAALGLHASHFSATAGLDDPLCYSSAYDLAVIAAYTYEHFPLFDQIVGSRASTCRPVPSTRRFTFTTLTPCCRHIRPRWESSRAGPATPARASSGWRSAAGIACSRCS